MVVDSRKLKSAIQQLKSAVATQSSQVQAIRGILIKDGKATAYNLNFGISVDIGLEGEPFILPPEALPLIPMLPGGAVRFSVGETLNVRMLTMVCGTVIARYPIFPADEWPEVAIPQADSQIEVEAEVLFEAIRQVEYAALRSDVSGMKAAVHIHSDGSNLSIEATDGYRIACKSIPASGDIDLLVPAFCLQACLSINADKIIRISSSGTMIVIDYCGATFFSRTMSGKYPDLKALISPGNNVLRVDARGLVDALDRVSVSMDRRRLTSTVLRLRGDHVGLAMSSLAQLEDEVTAECSADVDISVNHKYLRDALDSFGNNEVQISYGNDLAMLLIQSSGVKGLMAGVMPVRRLGYG